MSHPSPSLVPQWLRDLRRSARVRPDWLWHGYLAAGAMTLLTSQWKTGKTTLLSLLLDRMKSGGELVGEPVKPGKAVIVSEEPADLWVERSQRYRFTRHVCWFCRPFAGRPTHAQWQSLIDSLLDVHRQAGISLVAIDPLAAFFPAGCENNADAMLNALSPLRQLTESRLSVLVMHHPRKDTRGEGALARGSGVLCSHADILMEMHRFPSRLEGDRRRRLLAWSRWDETAPNRLITLTPEADDYLILPDDFPDEAQPVRAVLWLILGSASTKLSCEELLEQWPPEVPRPSKATLWRTLCTAIERGELNCDGAGVRADPFRYWLPSLEERWASDPMARLLQSVADSRRAIATGTVGPDRVAEE
jgi:hypothetical protein